MLRAAALVCLAAALKAPHGPSRRLGRRLASSQPAPDELWVPTPSKPLPTTAEDIFWTPSSRDSSRDEAFGPLQSPGGDNGARYCESLEAVLRRPTRTVTAGPVKFGSQHPIVRQTMGTTSTRDVRGTIEQVMRCADVGFDLVRITVVGMKEAQACHEIREGLFKKGYDIPLCADMHFQPAVAIKTAEAVEKIRINPGNFADGRKEDEDNVSFDSEADFLKPRDNIVEAFAPLVEKCKENNVAMRIGTNHGSLAARILSFYGDSPRGMVESALEFADVCRALDYHNFVFSMKASNPVVMIQGYRLLAAEMYRLGWDYPLHLGVTEAGEGEDGRMKSAIGIGTLLGDGLGDTIRVSLTEDPEYEYGPCNRLAELAGEQLGTKARGEQAAVPPFVDSRDVTTFVRRRGALPEQRDQDVFDYRGLLHRDGSAYGAVSLAELQGCAALGGLGDAALFRALGALVDELPPGPDGLVSILPRRDVATVDAILLREVPESDDVNTLNLIKRLQDAGVHFLMDDAVLRTAPEPLKSGGVPMVRCDQLQAFEPAPSKRLAVICDGNESDEMLRELMATQNIDVVMLDVEEPGLSRIHASRRLFSLLRAAKSDLSVVHHLRVPKGTKKDELALSLGMRAGALLGDGLGDGLLVEPDETSDFDLNYLRETSFALLQGSRMRNTKTEFVSCPSCGRTLFDLQEVTAQISEKTGHLPGVAIAIMGCIVNGPGEMADADFGYVGGAPGKIDLYVGKTVVEKAIPNEVACDKLVELIKEHGMWVDKPDEIEDAAPVEAELLTA